ncbi:exodeoxyribonuclease VII small subunit [bacterium]|nr:exodeoxyribonuclease VII small subunit [bacterium]
MAKKSTDKPTTPPEDVPLEQEIARLEEIVGQLESGETSLEKSIDLYAEGHRIGRKALQRLEGLERRIEVVAREGADGSLQTVEFEGDEE